MASLTAFRNIGAAIASSSQAREHDAAAHQGGQAAGKQDLQLSKRNVSGLSALGDIGQFFEHINTDNVSKCKQISELKNLVKEVRFPPLSGRVCSTPAEERTARVGSHTSEHAWARP